MDITTFFDPVVATVTFATIASLAVLVALWFARQSIGAMISQVRQRLFTRTGFFWLVNIVFMAVSVLHAGVFFGITGSSDMAVLLGFAVSFFLDLVTVILMQAMLESRYRGEDGRARQFLFFITVCCGTSTFANLAISLNDFNAAKMLPNAPLWVQVAAPYVLASFPLFVIMMSIAAEMIINLRPLESLDEDEYETDEKKRIRIIEIRNNYLEKQMAEEQRLLIIRAQMKANKENKRAHHEPMLPRLLSLRSKAVDVTALITAKTEQLEEHYNEVIGRLQEQIHSLQSVPATTQNMALQGSPSSAQNRHEQSNNEQSQAPIDLESKRAKREQRDTEDLAPSPAKRSKESDALLQKAKEIVAQNPKITAEELGAKISRSRSYAGKLKTRIIEEQRASTTA